MTIWFKNIRLKPVKIYDSLLQYLLFFCNIPRSQSELNAELRKFLQKLDSQTRGDFLTLCALLQNPTGGEGRFLTFFVKFFINLFRQFSPVFIGPKFIFFIIYFTIPLGSRKAGRSETLFRFANSHSIVTRGSVSLSCATTPHPSCFYKS